MRNKYEKDWLIFNRWQRSRERYYAPKINKVLKKQLQQFIDDVKSGVGEETALTYVSGKGITQLLKDLYTDAATTYGAKIWASLPKKKAMRPMGFNQWVIDFITNLFTSVLLQRIKDIEETTRDFIRQVLIRNYPLGSSFDVIEKELMSSDITKVRARLIARTETVTSANMAAMSSAKQSGLELNKVWSSSQDNRTRRVPRNNFDHLHMNGVEIGIDELFVVSGELMMQPGDGLHGASAGNICNCRCRVVFKEKT